MTTPADQPDLATWLRIQLDADAAEIAKHPDDDEYEAWDLSAEMETNYPCLPYLRIGKKRALAEVDTKRLILDECESAIRKSAPRSNLNDLGWLVLRPLAMPYATRPGYRAEWRPA